MVLCAKEVGKFNLKAGKVKITRDKKTVFYGPKPQSISILEKDQIRTGPSSVSEIELTNRKDNIRLYANVILDMDKVGGEKISLNLKVGKVKFVVDQSIQVSFEILTPNSIISVKGTEFVVLTDVVSTSVATLEGSVSLSSLKDPTQSVDVPEGTFSKTVRNRPPTLPVTLTPKSKAALLKDNRSISIPDIAKKKEDVEETKEKNKTKGSH